MKKIGKKIVVRILQWQVGRLANRNKFKIVGVVGSIGKTSTKLAIVSVLKSKYRVQFQQGNYNDSVTVPLVFFGLSSPPTLLNPLAWLNIFISNERIIKQLYPFDIVVLELGTDGPGQIDSFKKYLKLDIAVITAIAYEHMEFFTDLDAVAREETAITAFADTIIANNDLCGSYIDDTPDVITYGLQKGDYHYMNLTYQNGVFGFDVNNADKKLVSTSYVGFADSELYSVIAAVTVGVKLGLNAAELIGGIAGIRPPSGRMRPLKGIKNSTILDDSYNASPQATKSALETIYKLDFPSRIVLLGNMNELGGFSQDSHQAIGNFCDPNKLQLVVTLGPDANAYLAPAAEARGCKVMRTNTPYEAGVAIKDHIKENSLVLVKGSQNGVFAEEAIKFILANANDTAKLVRQSPFWISIKQAQFKKTKK